MILLATIRRELRKTSLSSTGTQHASTVGKNVATLLREKQESLEFRFALS
jgi:hypothetical protein